MPLDKEIDVVVQHLLAARKQTTREDLISLVKAVQQAGGVYEGTAAEPEDGTCPEWRIPFPPRDNQAINSVFEAAWRVKGNVKIFPKGIINPDSLRVVVTGLNKKL